MTRNIMLLISVIVPIGILSMLYHYLHDSSDNPTEIHPGILGLDERFQNTKPDIIVVGSSVANKAIERSEFAKLMGVPLNKLQILWSGKATMFVIDMMIEQRILQQNVQPKAIVIISPPYWLGNYAVLHDEHFAMHNTGPIQPVVRGILEAQGHVVPSLFKQRKKLFQNQYQSMNQQLVGHYFWGLDSDELDKQLEGVFAGDNTRLDSVKTHQLIQANAVETDTVEQSRQPFDLQILAHLAEKLQAANIQLSVVTAPVSKEVRSAQSISASDERLLKETLLQYNAGYLNFFDWEIPGMFIDNFHMGRLGRKTFTPMLSAKLTELGLLTQNFPQEVFIDNLTPITQAPTLQWPQKERTLLPAEELNISFPVEISAFKMTLCASSNKPSKGGFSLNATQFNKVIGNKRLWCEVLSGSNIQANTSMNILNGYANPVTIHKLDINGVDILEPPKAIVAKHTEWHHESKSSAQQTMTMLEKGPKWLLRKKKSMPNLQLGQLGDFGKISDVRLLEANVPRECRPVQVLHTDSPLPVKTCKELWKTQQGQCIYRDEFVINQQAPVDWQQMTLQLKEERFCTKTKKIGYWFHPGDTATSTFNYPKGEYSTLIIEGSGLGDGEWSIELIDDSQVFVQETIPQRLDGQYSILLNQPFKRKHHQTKIRLSVPESSTQHLFIQKISLTN